MGGLRDTEGATLTGLGGSWALGRGRRQGHSHLQVTGLEKLVQVVSAWPGNSGGRGKEKSLSW